MLALWGSFLLLGKVGKGISEESVAERNQWDPGTGWKVWGRVGLWCSAVMGKWARDSNIKPVRGGETLRMSEAPLLLPVLNTHTGPAGTGWSHLQCCKKLFLPQPLLLTLCSCKAAGKGKNGKGGKDSCQGYQNGDSAWPKPFAVSPEPFWATSGKSCISSSSCRILMLRWTHCSDRAAVPEGLQIYGSHVLEIPSLLVTQRRCLAWPVMLNLLPIPKVSSSP